MSFPRYPSYKDSGVELLGNVPGHWDLKRFKRIFKEREERSVDGDELLLSVSAYTGVSPRSEVIDDGDHLSRADSLEGYKICHKDDLVVNIMLAWNRGLAFTSYHGIVSPAYCVYFVVDGSHTNFLNYLVRSNEYTLYFKAFSSGVIDSRLRIYPGTFGRLVCALPPLAEQSSIAAFLDRETAKIDALVAEQQRLMELLKEKRQAVISHAVTKGLNPKAPLKPSGIEWLGDVPTHWNVSPLKHVSRIESGHTPQKTNEAYWVPEDCCIPWISLNDTKILAASDFIDDTTVKISAEGMANSSAHLIEAGAVVMNRDGARVGLAAITAKPMCVSQHIIAWVCGPSVFNHYLLHVLYAMQDEISSLTGGSTIPTIGMPEVRQMTMPLPPVDEQTAIVRYLLEERRRIDTLTAEAQRAIDLLQERRTALISAAVTGQIDVRNQ